MQSENPGVLLILKFYISAVLWALLKALIQTYQLKIKYREMWTPETLKWTSRAHLQLCVYVFLSVLELLETFGSK